MIAPKTPVVYPDVHLPIVAVTGARDRAAKFHRHTGRDWEFCYVRTGEAKLRVDDAQWDLRAGDLLVIRPDESHACLSWRGERSVLIIRQSLLRSLPVDVRFTHDAALVIEGTPIPKRLSVALPHRPYAEQLVDRLQQESLGAEPTKRTMCAVILAQWLLEIARGAQDHHDEHDRPVGSAARRTVEKLCDQLLADIASPWTLAELVSRSGYGATQLSYLFNHVLGVSPIHWLTQQRVERACRLLSDSDRTTIQIAVDVGFGSRSQFHRAFRRTMGTTPARYRAIVRHEQHP